MRPTYLLSPRAARDLLAIRRYLRRTADLQIAARVESQLREAFDHLAHFPGAGHLRPDLTTLQLRFWPVRPYMIVYRQRSPIEIVTVTHGHRDLAGLLPHRIS